MTLSNYGFTVNLNFYCQATDNCSGSLYQFTINYIAINDSLKPLMLLKSNLALKYFSSPNTLSLQLPRPVNLNSVCFVWCIGFKKYKNASNILVLNFTGSLKSATIFQLRIIQISNAPQIVVGYAAIDSTLLYNGKRFEVNLTPTSTLSNL